MEMLGSHLIAAGLGAGALLILQVSWGWLKTLALNAARAELNRLAGGAAVTINPAQAVVPNVNPIVDLNARIAALEAALKAASPPAPHA
jgi:hypothetical protein